MSSRFRSYHIVLFPLLGRMLLCCCVVGVGWNILLHIINVNHHQDTDVPQVCSMSTQRVSWIVLHQPQMINEMRAKEQRKQNALILRNHPSRITFWRTLFSLDTDIYYHHHIFLFFSAFFQVGLWSSCHSLHRIRMDITVSAANGKRISGAYYYYSLHAYCVQSCVNFSKSKFIKA